VDGEENYCPDMAATYSWMGKGSDMPTFGGYSTQMTVDENYVLSVSPRLSPAAAAPLLCAGITTYAPLMHWRAGKGSKVGVIGLGGLGHIAVKIAAAMGAEVTVFSGSASKRADAIRHGAADFVVSKDSAALAAVTDRFDLILNSVSGSIDTDAYINLLKRDGTLVFVGVPDKPLSINAFGLIRHRRSVSASLIGSIRETQLMLDFCAEHRIESDIEIIPIQQVNEAFERIIRNDVRYRFVIDMATLR
jgi:alcohol dehydrogenase (NADP+)